MRNLCTWKQTWGGGKVSVLPSKFRGTSFYPRNVLHGAEMKNIVMHTLTRGHKAVEGKSKARQKPKTPLFQHHTIIYQPISVMLPMDQTQITRLSNQKASHCNASHDPVHVL